MGNQLTKRRKIDEKINFLECLPIEIVAIKILPNLNIVEILELARLNKHIRDFVVRHPLLWSYLSREHFGTERIEKVREFIVCELKSENWFGLYRSLTKLSKFLSRNFTQTYEDFDLLRNWEFAIDKRRANLMTSLEKNFGLLHPVFENVDLTRVIKDNTYEQFKEKIRMLQRLVKRKGGFLSNYNFVDFFGEIVDGKFTNGQYIHDFSVKLNIHYSGEINGGGFGFGVMVIYKKDVGRIFESEGQFELWKLTGKCKSVYKNGDLEEGIYHDDNLLSGRIVSISHNLILEGENSIVRQNGPNRKIFIGQVYRLVIDQGGHKKGELLYCGKWINGVNERYSDENSRFNFVHCFECYVYPIRGHMKELHDGDFTYNVCAKCAK